MIFNHWWFPRLVREIVLCSINVVRASFRLV